MKNLLLFAAFAGLLSFASCSEEDDTNKQDYTCTCKDASGATTGSTTIPNTTRGNAETSCDNLTTGGVTCTLD